MGFEAEGGEKRGLVRGDGCGGSVVVECGEGADEGADGGRFGIGAAATAGVGRALGDEPDAGETTGNALGLGALGRSEAGAVAVSAQELLQAFLPTGLVGVVGAESGFAIGGILGARVKRGGVGGASLQIGSGGGAAESGTTDGLPPMGGSLEESCG